MKWIVLVVILLLVPLVLGVANPTQGITTYHCVDPDNENINPEYTSSVVSVTTEINNLQTVIEQHPDFCMTSETLKEYYCVNDIGWDTTNLIGYGHYLCEYGCENGACLEPTLLDQDLEVQGLDLEIDELPWVADCSDGYDNDGDGFIDMADAGCAFPDDDYEDNACGDYWDNDNDNYKDYYGGCDIDGDGWTDYYCGCDLNFNNYLEVNGAYGVNEFNIKYEDCMGTFGCINLASVTTQGFIDPTNICNGGNIYLPDPECESFGDDSERDSGMQLGGSFIKINVLKTFSLIQGAFLTIPPGVGFFLYLF